MNLKNNSKGITLVALVVTIIVLLILAAVSINLVAGGDGILGKATTAVNETNKAKITEEIELAMAELKTDYYEARYVERDPDVKDFADYAEKKLTSGVTTSSGGKITLSGTTISFTEKGETKPSATGTFNKEDGGSATIGGITIEGTENKVTIPEGLEVGATVTYTPSGTYDEWTTAHSGWDTSYSLASGSSYSADDTTLTDMTISSWKVFKIDEETGEVKLIPSAPTTNELYLKGADGYNNSVKLLNDACSSLYSDSSKGITARSINIDDIEDKEDGEVLDYDPTTYSNSNASYKGQKAAYTSHKTYPAIYAEEIDSVIEPIPEGKNKTLGLNKAASDWIIGSVANAISIQPKQTYYYLNNSDFSSKLKGEYSSLLLLNGSSTQYWVASRCATLYPSGCNFSVRYVNSGGLAARNMLASDGTPDNIARSLFPVVSLSSELIAGDSTSGWSVE